MNTGKRYVSIGLLSLLLSLIAFFARAQCSPNFIDSVNSASCGLVSFTNQSTPNNSLVTYSWNFPSGSPATSSLTNPSTTYSVNGTYTVCLFMISTVPSCSANICKTITVNCFTTTCTANFSPSLCIGGTMQFVDTSPGTNSTTVYDWDFGNSTTSNLANPTATYNANGIYTVCLSYTTTAPAYCTATICKTVNINCVAGPTCAVSFNTLCTQTGTNAQVSFSNTSSGTNSTTTYSWSFGGSAPTSTNQNPPPVTYTANGTYTVCLSINTPSPPCMDSICQVINVNCVPTPTTGPCQANFTNTPCNSNGQVTFYSTSTGTNASTGYTWQTSALPTQPSGSYTTYVCLIIKNTTPTVCSNSICKTVTVDCAVGIPEFIFDSKGIIGVFPNPGNGSFVLDLEHANLSSSFVQIKVYNVLGELVYQGREEIDQGKLKKEIDLQHLPNGAYFFRMNADDKVYSVKLIISK